MHSADRRRPSTLAVVVALLIVYVVWGSTYLGIAVMIETMPPLLATGVRFVIAGSVVMVGVLLHARATGADALDRPAVSTWTAAFVVGTLLLVGGNGGVSLGELVIPSGVAAVLIATMPIWMSVFDSIATRRRPSALVVGGLLAGLVGVAIMLAPVEGIGDLDPLGVALVLGAATSWALGSVYARSAPLPRNGLLSSGMTMLAGGLALIVVGTALGEIGQVDLAAFSTRSWVAFWYLVLVGSLVAFTAYTWLLANVSVSTVATYAYVNPIVAVVLGATLLNEEIAPRTLLAGAIIVGAVVAMVSGRPRMTEEPGPAPEVAPLEARNP